MDFETKDLSKLDTLAFALSNYFAHSSPNGKLYKNTGQALVDFLSPFVSALGASSYVPISGNVLPDPVGSNSYSIVGAGTYTQTGESSLILTNTLNIISWNGTTWVLTKGISIDLSKFAFKYQLLETQPGKNLFNKESATPNAFIDATGTQQPAADFYATDYIVVEPFLNYYKNTDKLGAFYDSNKSVLSTFPNGTMLLNAPENAKYVRYTIDNAEINTAQIELGESFTSYSAFTNMLNGGKIVDKSISENKMAFKFVKGSVKNLFDKDTAVAGTYIDVNGERYVGIGFYSSDYIEVDSSTTYHKNTFNLGAFYDENKDFISATLNGDLTITSPVGAKYFRYSIPNAEIDIAQLEKGNIETEYEPNEPKINRSDIRDFEVVKPINIKNQLSKFAPVFYREQKAQNRDMVVNLQGDSISTNNYYANPRLDAKFRPPLMTEFSYVSYIEEQLRWDGQLYNRYDTGIFVEDADTKETKEYDQAWDWIGAEPQANYNNRPALTRILSGNNSAVKWSVPTGVRRCDYIYRTDYLNADTARINVFGGNGNMEVFNENTGVWIEAHNFQFSAKEVNEVLPGGLRKSMYQKRLKMRVVTNYTGVVQIINNGSGRLCYWGIQTSTKDFILDFIVSARGGHSIARLQNYEAWDLDYWNPDLILWEIPLLNQNMDVANPDYSPKNMGTRTTDVFSQEILNKAVNYINKSYAPELVSWVMYFGTGNNAIKPNNDWAYGFCNDGSRVSVPNYISATVSKFITSNINILDLFSLYIECAKRKGLNEGTGVLESTLNGSGMDGTTWTIDGGHFNTTGADITRQIFNSFFIQ